MASAALQRLGRSLRLLFKLARRFLLRLGYASGFQLGGAGALLLCTHSLLPLRNLLRQLLTQGFFTGSFKLGQAHPLGLNALAGQAFFFSLGHALARFFFTGGQFLRSFGAGQSSSLTAM